MLHPLRSLLVIFTFTGGLLPAAAVADDVPPADAPAPVLNNAAGAGGAASAERVAAGEDGPALTRQDVDLSGVSDRTPLEFEEAAAYYALLEQVRTVDPAALRRQAREFLQQRWEDSPRFRQFPLEDYPLFYDLTQHPDEYRGEPVSLRGHLIRLVKYAAGPNDYGIETLYEGWLVTPDAETHPTTVICTEIPEGMPIGEELIDGVSVSGYFFKLHTYSSRDRKVRFAPMVLAHRLEWSPAAAATGWPFAWTSTILAVLAAAVLAVVVMTISFRRRSADRQRRFRESVPETPPEFLNDLTP